MLEDHVKIVSEEVSSLKQEYTQSEKEKLEAQTRLEVLSGYFKEKETQLQKYVGFKVYGTKFIEPLKFAGN